jgi:O-antigen biosynthesis protein
MFKHQGKPGFKIIYELDDVVAPVDALPDFNMCKSQFSDPQIEKNVREILHMCDEMTVPSEAMRQHYRSFTGFDKISVIPNYVPRYWFDMAVTEDTIVDRYKKHKDKPRILYAGSSTHFDLAGLNGQQDDFSHVLPVILADITGPKKYQWVFLGGCPRAIQPYVDSGEVERHPWSSMTEYPRAIHNLDVNVMIAPLANHKFNHCKANIKLTEGAALGIPTIAQNLSCYNHDGWQYLFDTGEQMMNLIEDVLKDETSIRKAFTDIREYGNRYWLVDHLQDWLDVYTTPYGDHSRKTNKDFYVRNKEQFEK